MVHDMNTAGGSCCFESTCPPIDPLAADHIVVAGAVEGSGCASAGSGGCALVTVYFPVQEYRAGFCPAEALKRGTLFPELVSDYVGGCC